MENSTFVFTIYTLSDAAGNVRYVGITKRALPFRLKEHIKKSKHGRTHRDCWIRSLTQPPTIKEIEITEDSSREQYWIESFRLSGCRLTNLTDGGDGVSGYRHTEATRVRLSRAHSGRSKSEETRCAMSSGTKESWRISNRRETMSAALRGHTVSEETRQKISATRKKRYADGATNPMLGRKQSPESCAKNRASQLARSAQRRLQNDINA